MVNLIYNNCQVNKKQTIKNCNPHFHTIRIFPSSLPISVPMNLYSLYTNKLYSEVFFLIIKVMHVH